jgi:DNA-binding GntR family transcriptional regulator
MAVDRTTYVLERLREDITAAVIKPGASIRQVEIARRYGVSATPVREALRRLEAEGVIVYTANRGATLREITTDDVEDLSMMRAELEGLATRIAVARIEPQSLEHLCEIHMHMIGAVASGAPKTDLARLNRDFHFAIYASGSRVFAEQIRSIWVLSPPAEAIWSDDAAADASTTDHEAIIHAIEAGEADAARSLMAAHILRGANIARALDLRAAANRVGQLRRPRARRATA